MPIVDLPRPDDHLDQGDILQGVPLLVSGADGKAKTAKPAPYVLVVSRRCDAFRATLVTVAPVYAHPIHLQEVHKKLGGEEQQGKAKSKPREPGYGLDGMRRFLAGIRDGGQYYDAFYLGPLEKGSQTRYAAQLETLFTIEVPESPRRPEFVEKHRVGRLSRDFINDLHFRLSASYARLGFDDYEWFADSDLEAMITIGEAEVSQRQSSVHDVAMSIQALEGAGQEAKPQLRAELEKKKADLRRVQEALVPYLAERARRRAPDATRDAEGM